jgi:hypothetical protein
MTIGRLAWIIGAAIFILIVNVTLTVGYMVVYGYLINPGQPESVYQEHVKTAGPYCSIVFGVPLFYFVCRFIGGFWERSFAVKAALSVWLTYFLIDATILITSGLTLWVSAMAVISLFTKLTAAYFGGAAASKRIS